VLFPKTSCKNPLLWISSTDLKYSKPSEEMLKSPTRMLPSGKLTQLWKIAIFNGKIHYKWPFSIAMLNYQAVKNDAFVFHIFPRFQLFYFAWACYNGL